MPTLFWAAPIRTSSIVPFRSVNSPRSLMPPSLNSTSREACSADCGVSSTVVWAIYASASSIASFRLVRASVGSMPLMSCSSSAVLVVNPGEMTRARSAKAITITRVACGAPPKLNQLLPVRFTVLSSRRACSFAASRRVSVPPPLSFASRVFIDAELSIIRIRLFSRLVSLCTIGRARANTPASSTSSCSSSSRFLRSF